MKTESFVKLERAINEFVKENKETDSILSCDKCKLGKWFPTSFNFCPFCRKRIILNDSGFVILRIGEP